MDEFVRQPHHVDRVRSPVGAGALYPADAAELGRRLHSLLEAAGPTPADAGTAPKAVIVPHGGLHYSGPVAAHAFRALRPTAAGIRRVVLVGPAHRGRVEGLVVPEAEAFATPLGQVRVDAGAVSRLLSLPSVRRSDGPHRREHGLEMQLPFLQFVLRAFEVVPIIAGDAGADTIAAALEHVWGGPETLVVATSDLCAHRPYRDALQMDAATAGRIVRHERGYARDTACGAAIIDALVQTACGRGLAAALLDLGNSADMGGDAGRVVGYGAFGFYGR